MWKRIAVVLWFCLIFSFSSFAESSAVDEIRSSNVTISIQPQHNLVNPNSRSALAVNFELAKDWHFYASDVSRLSVKAFSEDYISFYQSLFPDSEMYVIELAGQKQRTEVFSNSFAVYLPFEVGDVSLGAGESVEARFEIKIGGAMCSGASCIMPAFEPLTAVVKVAADTMIEAAFELPDSAWSKKAAEPSLAGPVSWSSYSVWMALLLAFLAGLILNIMPCVWPVLPLIVLRIVKQAEQSKGKSIIMGLIFCLGILIFFACLAGANIILQNFYNTTLSWGDHLRNPAIVMFLSLLMIVMALFMFGVFTITLPSSITSKTGSGEGYVGSMGMGFLAAILSTPCSFGILTVAFVWIQGQSLALGTLAIMIMGIGMAMPYAILTSMPGLLRRLPKSGRWMEFFKQTLGFILLFIAVKLLKGVPDVQIINLLYFAVVLSFCIWMWGVWVSYSTKLSRKLFVRIIAVVLAVLAFRVFFSPELIDWQEYDESIIGSALVEQRPVLLKFTAGWCTNCEFVDLLVYKRKDIAKLIEQKNVLAITADTTEKSFPATYALKKVYKEVGVPVSMLFVPGKEEPLRWRGIAFADDLKKSLKELTSEKEDGKNSKE